MKIANDPISIMLDIFEENYEEVAKKISGIYYYPKKMGRKVYAQTTFNDDGTIRIDIATIGKKKRPIGIEDTTELLAHELAHAICGLDAGHGKEWQDTFERLHTLYCLKVMGVSLSEVTE